MVPQKIEAAQVMVRLVVPPKVEAAWRAVDGLMKWDLRKEQQREKREKRRERREERWFRRREEEKEVHKVEKIGGEKRKKRRE